MNFQGFMGMPMDEKIFADMQKNNPGFHAGGVFRQKQPPLDLSKKKEGEPLTNQEMTQLVFANIFGSYGFPKNLDEAETICKYILTELDKVKPTADRHRKNNRWMIWQNQYGQAQVQLGTIYAYKNEIIKAAYHFMLGLKSEMVAMNMPYCDFIRYIVAKLNDLPKEKAAYHGRGFSPNKPMGCAPGERVALDAQIAMSVIPEMEGKNGEVIVARKGNMVFYGHLKRLGSCGGNIDIYETWLIDKGYNIKSIELYFNGYRDLAAFKPLITTATGFAIKTHTILHEMFEFVDEPKEGLCRICGVKVIKDKDVCKDCLNKRDVRIMMPLG